MNLVPVAMGLKIVKATINPRLFTHSLTHSLPGCVSTRTTAAVHPLLRNTDAITSAGGSRFPRPYICHVWIKSWVAVASAECDDRQAFSPRLTSGRLAYWATLAAWVYSSHPGTIARTTRWLSSFKAEQTVETRVKQPKMKHITLLEYAITMGCQSAI